jgi:hypothetical protein
MTADARQLARAFVGLYRERVAHHLGDGAFRAIADAVDAAVVARLDVEDDDTLKRLRRAAHAASLGKGEAIMAGAPAVAAVLDAGVLLATGLELADDDPEEARYSIGAALVALADADVEENERARAGGAAVVDRDAALAPLRAALRARLRG